MPTPSSAPADFTAAQALAALRSGELTAEALTRACLDRIAARDALIRAWAAIDPEIALAQARRLDALPPDQRGPLHGLPVGVKDVIHTRDFPTRYNSPLHADAAGAPDAASVTLLRRAGAVILGKTTTVEFAGVGATPPTRNPHDSARTPGGSSSGSAAAVADGHVPLALGTQTGGSVIRPASFCGVWAMKPSWGRISHEGCKRFAPTLDTLGWFARSADDLALLLEAFDPTPKPIAAAPNVKTLRIGLCRTPIWSSADAATRDAFFSAETALRASGASIEPLNLDELLAPLPALQRRVMRAEGHVSFQPERGLLDGEMAAMADGVDVVSQAERLADLDAAALARPVFDKVATPYDAVLVPSVIGEAPEGLAATGDLLFNGLWTLLHVPCVNVPGWSGPNGLPVGLTLVGARFADRRVMDVARAFGRLISSGTP